MLYGNSYNFLFVCHHYPPTHNRLRAHQNPPCVFLTYCLPARRPEGPAFPVTVTSLAPDRNVLSPRRSAPDPQRRDVRGHVRSQTSSDHPLVRSPGMYRPLRAQRSSLLQSLLASPPSPQRIKLMSSSIMADLEEVRLERWDIRWLCNSFFLIFFIFPAAEKVKAMSHCIRQEKRSPQVPERIEEGTPHHNIITHSTEHWGLRSRKRRNSGDSGASI